jgi:hypothetical protein
VAWYVEPVNSGFVGVGDAAGATAVWPDVVAVAGTGVLVGEEQAPAARIATASKPPRR